MPFGEIFKVKRYFTLNVYLCLMVMPSNSITTPSNTNIMPMKASVAKKIRMVPTKINSTLQNRLLDCLRNIMNATCANAREENVRQRCI